MLTQGLTLFAVCLGGAALSALAPFPLPASVAAMAALFLLLLLKVIRPARIGELCDFLLKNMAVLFVPATVGLMEIFDEIKPRLLPIVFICVVTTVLTFAAAAGTVAGVIRIQQKWGDRRG